MTLKRDEDIVDSWMVDLRVGDKIEERSILGAKLMGGWNGHFGVASAGTGR